MGHFDIKPENFLIGQDGNIKLSDLGVAKSLDATQEPLSKLRTTMYTAPEILAKSNQINRK